MGSLSALTWCLVFGVEIRTVLKGHPNLLDAPPSVAENLSTPEGQN